MDAEAQLLKRLTESSELLAQIPPGSTLDLRLQTRLRQQFDPELVRAAMTLSELRHRAGDRFVHSREMWFDRIELEQSTPDQIARHKAERFVAASPERVTDLYCGFGSNSIGLAASGLQVDAVDTSEVTGLRLALNATLYGVQDRIHYQLCHDPLSKISDNLIHLHPRRGAAQLKSVRLEEHLPNLEQLQSVVQQCSGGAITLSPASNFGGKFNDCEVELISLNGECKEAVVWFGSLRKDHAVQATILPSGWTISGNPWEAYSAVGPLRTYLYDPNPAVVRAGLIDLLAEQLQLDRLDPAEEYLTGDQPDCGPAVTAYEVLADLPNNDRDIRQFFRERDFGNVEIRCRHVPVDAAALRRKLPLKGKGKATLFFARLDGKTRAVIGRKVEPAA